jgi:Response regulator containing CheY-like receiver domain and AraC-type DNA-binding domain
MKILVVDDEVITRKGLKSNIDWDSLQIKEIYEADDGQSALEIARIHKPEIILTDIRMPRMDGITLANKLKDLLPGSSIIFMSGYSDREYLKAAIRLRAVSYVEKPINSQEVENAIAEAIQIHNIMEQNKYTKTIQYQTASSQLAIDLISPKSQKDTAVEELAASLNLEFLRSATITTLLVKTKPVFSYIGQAELTEFMNKLRQMARLKKFSFLYALKNEYHLIFHIYSQEKYTNSALMSFTRYMREQLEPLGNFFIAVGNTVGGMERVYESYHSAVLLLQSSFFYDYNSIITENNSTGQNFIFLGEKSAEFMEAIQAKDLKKSKEIAGIIYNHLRNGKALLPSQVKDIYYKLFIAIENTYMTQLLAYSEDTVSIWDMISGSEILKELDKLLLHKLDELFYAMEHNEPENSMVFMIKEYIHKNYFNDTLSVRDISDYVYLSTTYACTLFKNETNKTINQYLTEYRIEKAKQLLMDPRYKIGDISVKVGYSDGNYFAKSFKRIMGLSPSEFREKMLT